MRKGGWVQTYTGRQFWPLDPRPEDVCIDDIAHALSLTCRFSGHCDAFYSVAQHSVLVAQHVYPENQLAAILHDASEAYIADIPRPVKPYLDGYAEIEARIEKVVAQRFGATYPWPDEVKAVDTRILGDEQKCLMGTPPADWCLPLPPLGIEVTPWAPSFARAAFISMFEHAASVSEIVKSGDN